eukprot:Sdes_comp10454_c0_seq1m2151
MSVVGFDLGNRNCYIAVARQGGVEVIANEYSYRETPSVVAFTSKQRFLGESAKQQEVMNLKNTINQFKGLLGRNYDDPTIASELNRVLYETVKVSDGTIGVKVSLRNEEIVFSIHQIMSMLLVQLKNTAETELKTKVVDCVISVPNFWNDTQRRALIDAASIAGLNCLRLVNETTAAALAYGIYKQDLPAPEEKPRNVVIVDLGSASFKVSIASFLKGKLSVLASAFDTSLGGRDFDEALTRHFAAEFQSKYGLDVYKNPKSLIRLRAEAEKMKKLMSANSGDLAVNIECLMDDRDFKSTINREVFETLSASLLKRISTPLLKAFKDSGLAKEDIFSVEIIGGSSRIPGVKQICLDIFGMEVSTTLNADEAVARGACLLAAIISPNFRVRDFAIVDCTPFAITLNYPSSSAEESMEVFTANNYVPCTKALTFNRSEEFELSANYSEPELVPGKNPFISKFIIKNVVPDQDGEPSKIKVKVRLNPSGLFTVESAQLFEEGVREEVPAAETPASTTASATPSADTMESDDKSATPPEEEVPVEKKETKVKKVVRRVDLPIEAVTSSLPQPTLNSLIEQEASMALNDRMEIERADALNSLEEYVYMMRDAVETKYSEFICEASKEKFVSELSAAENWIYEEGEDQPKKVYAEKLKSLKKTGDSLVKKYNEASERPKAEEIFRRSLVLYRKVLNMYHEKDEKYAH